MFTDSGYEVIPKYGDPRLQKLVIDGVSIAPGVLAGDVHTILGWVAHQFNDTVMQLVDGDCWGYAPREIRGGSGWSNHASGTAIDLNGSTFKQGTRRMTGKQIAACTVIVLQGIGVVSWGGNYGGSTLVDQQHFEIANNMADSPRTARLAARIRNGDMANAADVLNAQVTVSDPFKTPTKQTVTVEKMLIDTFNSARCAHRDTQAIRKHLGI